LDITTPELYLGEIFGYGWEGSAEVYKVHVFSRLLWLDNTGKVTGGDLASDYRVSSDALTYTVTLRNGVKWHDGQPLTIEDVAWGVKATLRDSTAGGLFKSAFSTIVGAKEFMEDEAADISGMTVSGNTITFKLERPASTFAYVLGQWPVLPKHILEKANPDDLYSYEPYWAKPIGCGPYMFTEVVTNEYALMEIYPDYHGERPGIDKIYMALTGVNMVNLVPNDEIDFFASQDPGVISYMKDYPNYTMYEVPVNYVRYLMCNTVGKKGTTDGTAVSNFKVRKALLHALDLETMVGQLFGDMGSQTDSKMSNMKSPYHNPNNVMLDYDPELAKQLLDEAGYDYDYDFELVYYYNDQVGIDFVEAMKYYWEQIGMKVNTRLLTGDFANQMYFDRDYDVMYAGLGFVLPEDTFAQFLDTSIMTNVLGSDARWQELYNDLTTARGEQGRIEAAHALQDFEQTMLTQIPMYNLNIAYYVNSARVEIPTQYFGELRMAYNRHFEDWKLKK
jgi:peptide/nickel transport system substrate-binding protein